MVQHSNHKLIQRSIFLPKNFFWKASWTLPMKGSKKPWNFSCRRSVARPMLASVPMFEHKSRSKLSLRPLSFFSLNNVSHWSSAFGWCWWQYGSQSQVKYWHKALNVFLFILHTSKTFYCCFGSQHAVQLRANDIVSVKFTTWNIYRIFMNA